jgi:ribonuclease BN (tRNA processing enzyme)
MNIQFLGSCGNQTDSREAVAFIVETEKNKVLVETGPGISRQIYRAGRKCSDIDTIIVTHSHGDHSCGYPYVVWCNFYDRLGGAKGKDALTVIGMHSITEGLDKMLRFCYNPDSFPFKINYLNLSNADKDVVELDGLRISSIPVTHTAPNIGLRFDYQDKSICYSSDTVYSAPFVQLSQECDLLIHEAFVDTSKAELATKTKHATAQEAGRAASNARAKRLALVHLFPPYIGKENILVDEAHREYDGNVFVPEEFMTLSLD